ncbi:M1 family metallopeptidase [Aureispira anguillae]|nr:M1 family metallopeptidase [Aureispira anguillae]
MNLNKTLLIILLCIGVTASTQDKKFSTPLSPRTANYTIQLNLDTHKKQVQATQVLTFNNPSSDTIWTMPFHMYYNAFKNNKSTFMTEANGLMSTKSEEDIQQGLWSWIKILTVEDEQGNNLIDSLHFVAVDDANPNDHTVLELRLKTPILPYQSYELEMSWLSQIPKTAIRTGYSRDYFFMVQWYPKLGVYEPKNCRFAKEGQWNCHQYHANTEYFGEFGVYNVQMTVPKNFVVGASGFLLEEKEEGDKKSYTYLAEDVIDFAWTANPNFIVIEDEWKGVELKLMVMPEHQCNQDRFLKAAKYALDFFETYIEKYPYPTMTIVSPPYYGLFSGAMEYPTLFTAPTLCILPPNIRTTETLTMHELTHQYFMQMLSTNEQEEAWMDEGFTAFFEAKMMDKFYPKGVFYWDYMGINVGSEEYRRGRFFNADNIKIGPMSNAGWLFKHGGHREIVYGKASVWLKTLEGLVGETCMQEIIHTYFQRWKFKHPCRKDFIAIVNEIVPKHHGNQLGQDMNWFLDQVIYGTEECDYSVHKIINKEIIEPLGFFENTDQVQLPSEQKSEKMFEAKVILYRLGEVWLPQDVKITFDNGEIRLEKWDGKARSHDFTYRGKRKILSVEIDPSLKIPLDKNLINNSHTVEQKSSGITRYFTSFVTWMQAAMITASTLI